MKKRARETGQTKPESDELTFENASDSSSGEEPVIKTLRPPVADNPIEASDDEDEDIPPKEIGEGPNGTTIYQTKTGLQYMDVSVGKGRNPRRGERITVKYVGSLAVDAVVFDKGTISFTLGIGEVIAGWEEGLKSMAPGGQRRLVVPPGLAYGNRGAGGKIPPNSTLIFDLELVRIGTNTQKIANKLLKRKDEKDSMPLPCEHTKRGKRKIQNKLAILKGIGKPGEQAKTMRRADKKRFRSRGSRKDKNG